jgi:phage baseplate assembly protein W
MYEGPQKIHQDLALALQEAYGGDKLHPRWGSILQNFIGLPMTDDVKNKVLSEINRVISNYITVQNAKIVQSSNTGTQSNLSTDDVVRSVSSINAQQIYDSLVVSVVLETLSQQTVNINQVMSA